MSPRPPLDDTQIAAAINAVHAQREQAVRYVLAALDPTAFNAPALPYAEVLTRVEELIAAEIGRYAAAAAPAEAATGTEEKPEEPAHG